MMWEWREDWGYGTERRLAIMDGKEIGNIGWREDWWCGIERSRGVG